ncbi:40S ribosomal protein S4 [Eumeta japonica]|uniref:Small ribosomal subunit protein eS4 n=1 Tax=Eumeta variegata TaxID=151549 RepID=A0A4C1T670_EUMVA|nr:40S ribosomal protein S4 [Eumeta japonica]
MIQLVRKTQLGAKVFFYCHPTVITIRYPDPLIQANDTVQVDIATGKITDYIKFDSGNKPYISLPKGKGVKLSIAEERDKRLAAKAH